MDIHYLNNSDSDHEDNEHSGDESEIDNYQIMVNGDTCSLWNRSSVNLNVIERSVSTLPSATPSEHHSTHHYFAERHPAAPPTTVNSATPSFFRSSWQSTNSPAPLKDVNVWSYPEEGEISEDENLYHTQNTDQCQTSQAAEVRSGQQRTGEIVKDF
ncbi:hypothetical protein BGZ72_002082 [Mortierella alpina]|nr:hypothetical protein BGZ72_002082 [Mortierella alpina]